MVVGGGGLGVAPRVVVVVVGEGFSSGGEGGMYFRGWCVGGGSSTGGRGLLRFL